MRAMMMTFAAFGLTVSCWGGVSAEPVASKTPRVDPAESQLQSLKTSKQATVGKMGIDAVALSSLKTSEHSKVPTRSNPKVFSVSVDSGKLADLSASKSGKVMAVDPAKRPEPVSKTP
jgi:hypothetical protein